MSEPFLSEIKIVSFNYAPRGWALCNGQLLPINQNQALFALLGTTYGGNGQTNFALPNLQGQVPIHVGNGHTLGEKGGETAHTVNQQEMAQHLHLFQGSSKTGDLNVTTGNVLGISQVPIYGQPQNLTTINPGTITNVGGSQAHNNVMPYLVLNFIIALQGIFPSQN
jgi:microcystin-dependent protein